MVPLRQGGCFAACLRFVLAVRRLISAVDDERKDELFGFAGPNDELPAGEALFGQFVLFFFVHAAAEHAPAIELLSRSSTRALFGAAGANFCEQRCALRSRFWHSVLIFFRFFFFFAFLFILFFFCFGGAQRRFVLIFVLVRFSCC